MVEMDKQAIQRKAQVLTEKIAEVINEFTSETGAVVTEVMINPKIEPLGDTGLMQVTYNVQTNYGGLETHETNRINPGEGRIGEDSE